LKGKTMNAFLTRRKNWVALSLTLLTQLVLLGTQVTDRNNVRFLRIWANFLIIPAEQFTSATVDLTSDVWHHYIALRHASEENRQLKERIQALSLEKNRLDAEVQGSQRLKALLDLKEAAPWASVASEVIGSSPSEAFKSIILNTGANAGLTNNLPVLTPEGVVGRIVRVSAHSSWVQLITDSESGVGVVFEKSRIHGVAKGSGGSLLDIEYVVNEENISVGDVIRTSGEDQIYPKDLLVGTVVAMRSGSGIFKRITAVPAAQLSRLEEVLVMKKTPRRE
jgi:rod shape-determining protein MreC